MSEQNRIDELEAENDELRDRIEALSGENEILERDVNSNIGAWWKEMNEGRELRKRVESLDDAIRDMLDWATGFCRPTTDKEKLEAIEEIGVAALSPKAKPEENFKG